MPKGPKTWIQRWLGLTLAYFSLFITGTAPWRAMLPPPVPGTVVLGLLLLLDVAAVDAAILLGLVVTSRLHGWRLMVLVALEFYGVNTFISIIEAAYFMRGVTPAMLPALFLGTVPLAVGMGLLAPIVGRRLYSGDDDRVPGWLPLPMGWGEAAAKIVLLAGVVYPALFFAFGYYVAWSFPAVRAFYGGPSGATIWQHYARVFAAHPFLYPLEAARGLLWVALALAVLRTTRGPWWLGTLWVALLFVLVQNDVLLLPNPLMPASVRAVHFVETTSSNLVWAVCIGALLSRSHWRRPPEAGAAPA